MVHVHQWILQATRLHKLLFRFTHFEAMFLGAHQFVVLYHPAKLLHWSGHDLSSSLIITVCLRISSPFFVFSSDATLSFDSWLFGVTYSVVLSTQLYPHILCFSCKCHIADFLKFQADITFFKQGFISFTLPEYMNSSPSSYFVLIFILLYF